MNFDPTFLWTGSSGSRTYLNWLFEAWGWTLAVAGASWLLAMFAGTLIGVLRTLPVPAAESQIKHSLNLWLVRFAVAWVEIFRNIPLLVQIFLWYFVAPKIFPPLLEVPGFLMVVLALGLFTSARIAEQIRTGIQAQARGQRYAALAIGLTTWQSYRYVLLPTAFRIVLPPITSESMNILKNSSVAFAVSIPELSMYAMQVAEESSRTIETYLVVTILYIITALAINRALSYVEKSIRILGVTPAAASH